MRQSLQLKLSQHLTLTPQLQQSIRLLQLSTLELGQEIEQALAENPLLERVEDPSQNAVRLSGDMVMPERGSSSTPDTPDNNRQNDNEPRNESQERSGSDDIRDADMQMDNWGSDWPDDNRNSNDDDDDRMGRQLAGPQTDLKEHLQEQLRLSGCSAKDRGLVTLLIDALNEDGYLTLDLEDLYTALPEDLDTEPEELFTALRLLQSFDPPGVGARNASECLRLQMLARDDLDRGSLVYQLAMSIIDRHLELLAQRESTKLKKLLGANDEQLKAAHQLIRSLDPFPGARFTPSSDDYVIPDVIVKKIKSRWGATLNADVMPKLRINEMYAKILKSQRGHSTTQLAGQLQEARWLVKNIQQRFDTILRVSQAIVERQQGFFNHGEIAMQPLVLREIADELGLHESTVSRVTNQKYMLTPFGIFELKYFFGSHVSTDSGGAASSTAIRALIKQIVSAEDSKHPLSDSQIADLLGQQGLVVARRTVAKYRESLKIPPVSLRKSL